MGLQIGSKYAGSSSLQTSTGGDEIIPTNPVTSLPYVFYKLSFMNDQDCTVTINGNGPFFIRANQGFTHNEKDRPITSFIIVTASVSYNWLGGILR